MKNIQNIEKQEFKRKSKMKGEMLKKGTKTTWIHSFTNH